MTRKDRKRLVELASKATSAIAWERTVSFKGGMGTYLTRKALALSFGAELAVAR